MQQRFWCIGNGIGVQSELAVKGSVRFINTEQVDYPTFRLTKTEQLTAAFLSWIWTYPEQRRPHVLARLTRLAPGQQALIFHSPRAVDAFFDSLRGKRA